MVKKLITTNKGIQIGRESNTLLNLLVGANSKFMVDDEIKKINYLLSNSERIDIITDLSLYKSANRLWEYVYDNFTYFDEFLKENLPHIHLVKPEGLYLGWVDFRECGLNKDELEKTDIPYIISKGRKGGSNLAAAIINAILYAM